MLTITSWSFTMIFYHLIHLIHVCMMYVCMIHITMIFDPVHVSLVCRYLWSRSWCMYVWFTYMRTAYLFDPRSLIMMLVSVFLLLTFIQVTMWIWTKGYRHECWHAVVAQILSCGTSLSWQDSPGHQSTSQLACSSYLHWWQGDWPHRLCVWWVNLGGVKVHSSMA